MEMTFEIINEILKTLSDEMIRSIFHEQMRHVEEVIVANRGRIEWPSIGDEFASREHPKGD